MVDIPSVPNILQLTIVAVDATGRVLEQDDLTDQYINCVLKQNLFSPEIDLLITLSESKGSLTRFNKVGYQGQELVFLKFTNLPLESVNLPSSKTCNNKLKTSG